MEHENSKLMTPFDCQTIPQWIYILKLMLPYTPERYQHSLAVFIRFQEMQLTLKNFTGFGKKKSFDTIMNDVKPYMDSSTQEMMDQLESVMSMMEMMQMMTDFSQNTSDDPKEPHNVNPMDILSFFNMKGEFSNE